MCLAREFLSQTDQSPDPIAHLDTAALFSQTHLTFVTCDITTVSWGMQGLNVHCDLALLDN